MRPPLVERIRRLRRWLIPATLLALVPKCVLCVLAYTGLGVALGLGGPELCGGQTKTSWLAQWTPTRGAEAGETTAPR